MGKTNYLENKILDHVMGITAYTMPTVYLAAYTTAPTESSSGTEVTGGSYARVALAGKLSASSAGASANTAAVTFPTATANWGTIVSVGVCDASTGGNLLRYMSIDPDPVVINTGGTLSFAIGDLTFAETNAGKSAYLKNEMLDHMLGITSYTKPTIWLAAYAGIPGVDGGAAEISGNAYARVALADLLSAASNGIVTNGSDVVDFPTATGSWGEVSSVVTFDASSGGNMLRISPLAAPVIISTNQYLSFQVSALSFAED